MKVQPTPMNTSTTASLTATITALVRADSWIPIISSIETRNTIRTAGRLATPCTDRPSGSVTGSNGPAQNCAGSVIPNVCSSETTYADQLIDTVDAPIAYSSTRSQPMIQASHSPSV